MRVELGLRSYDICIGENWLSQIGQYLPSISKNSQTIMITDRNVFHLAGQQVLEVLHESGFKVEPAIIPGGEDCKNLATAALLYEQMVTAGLDRKSTVFALGGGIVGDVAGFVAATYMRGIDYIQIPTTLLAQVDSSVGGKTGVNLPLGKNLVGAFHQPRLVFIDVAFLDTLPEREYLTGLAEVIKYGVIWDRELFTYLEEHRQEIQARNKVCLQHIIERCCGIKAQIVAQDETESGLRALLNLGHTFGHAFEALTQYQLYTHGEAVAIGMICAGHLAHNLGLLSAGDLTRITGLIKDFGLPVEYAYLDSQAVVTQMHKDKKQIGGRMHVVLPVAIGQSRSFYDVSESSVFDALNQMSGL